MPPDTQTVPLCDCGDGRHGDSASAAGPVAAIRQGVSPSSSKKITVAFAAGVVVLIAVGSFSYRSLVAATESARWVAHSHQVLESLQDLLSSMQVAESSYRGFVLTGTDDYLHSYRAGTSRVREDIAAFRGLTVDNPEQQNALAAVERLADQKIAFGDMVIALRQTSGLDAAADAIRDGVGKGAMDAFQARIRELKGREMHLLVVREADAKRRAGQTKTMLGLGTALGLLIAAAAAWSIRRDGVARHLADQALRNSEEKYRMLLDGIPDYAIFMLDAAGRVASWNAGAERLEGYSAEQIMGRDFSCFFTAEDIARGRPAELLQSTAASGRHEGQGMRVRSDGSRFLASVIFTALRDPDGTLRGFSKISHDLTKATDSGTKYRGLLEAAPDAMVVVNQDGEIVLLNVQAEKQFGYRRDELLGQKVTNIIAEGFAERLVADDLRSAQDALDQQIGTGIELTGLRKDGSEFPIEIMLSPLESSEGILVTAAIRNISVRKAADRHLAQMEGRYRGLLEAAPDAMVVVNQDGEIVLLNVQAEKQFGYRRDELLGQKVTNIIREGFAERLIADGLRSAEDALDQQIGTGIELSAHRKDGSEFPIEIMLSPLDSSDGILVTAAIRDITARKKAEANLLQKVEDLNRSNAELGQFAYIASHDLQEPLRMVASYTQLLGKRYTGKLDSDADEFIAFAVDGASRMQRLIQDLLTFSRVGSKGAELIPTSSEDALLQALTNLRGSIEQTGALVTHDLLPDVMADETQLVQLLQNLVGNAIKYQGPGIPHVHVAATKNAGSKWLFSVQDDGLGIDRQYFDLIFGMFQRLHKREEFDGTGIGLAICKKIVERHGGRISVESQPGHGSTFRFALSDSEHRS